MTEKVKVTMDPAKIEELKKKYNITDEALAEITGNMNFTLPESTSKTLPLPHPDATKPGEPSFFNKIAAGEIGIGEAFLLMDYADRKERRDQRERKENDGNKQPIPSAAEIGKEVATALQNAGQIGKPTVSETEMPEWFKEVKENQDIILKRMTKEDEAKEKTALIKEATAPLEKRLEKQAEKIATLSKSPPTGVGPPKSGLDLYLDYRAKLKEANLIKEEKSSNILMVDKDGKPIQGIPVKGEIPAVVVYGPAIVKQVLDNIESTADRIAAKYGLGPAKTEAPKKPLIELPAKPTPTPAPETPPAATEPPEKLVKIPEKPPEIPIEEKPVELELPTPITPEAPEEPVTGEVPPVCYRCDTPVTTIETPRGNRYRCPKCRKFTKIKEVEKSGVEESPANN